MYHQQKNHSQFKEEFFNKSTKFSEKTLRFITEYENVKKHLLVEFEDYVYKITPNNLFKGKDLNIMSLLNKEKYIEKELLKLGINLKIVEAIIFKKIIFETKYGKCKLPFDKIKKFSKPNISSAINKTEFMINEFTEKHGNKYNYTRSVFINAITEVDIICKLHGVFRQGYPQHKAGQGCPKCAGISRKEKTVGNGGWGHRDWEITAEKSSNFDSYKLYIIRVFNDEESFYKIGRTYRKIEKRFAGFIYNYEVIQIRESFTPAKIYFLEKVFKEYNKEFKYEPKKKFHGYRECFSKIIDINNGEEIS